MRFFSCISLCSGKSIYSQIAPEDDVDKAISNSHTHASSVPASPHSSSANLYPVDDRKATNKVAPDAPMAAIITTPVFQMNPDRPPKSIIEALFALSISIKENTDYIYDCKDPCFGASVSFTPPSARDDGNTASPSALLSCLTASQSGPLLVGCVSSAQIKPIEDVCMRGLRQVLWLLERYPVYPSDGGDGGVIPLIGLLIALDIVLALVQQFLVPLAQADAMTLQFVLQSLLKAIAGVTRACSGSGSGCSKDLLAVYASVSMRALKLLLWSLFQVGTAHVQVLKTSASVKETAVSSTMLSTQHALLLSFPPCLQAVDALIGLYRSCCSSIPGGDAMQAAVSASPLYLLHWSLSSYCLQLCHWSVCELNPSSNDALVAKYTTVCVGLYASLVRMVRGGVAACVSSLPLYLDHVLGENMSEVRCVCVERMLLPQCFLGMYQLAQLWQVDEAGRLAALGGQYLSVVVGSQQTQTPAVVADASLDTPDSLIGELANLLLLFMTRISEEGLSPQGADVEIAAQNLAKVVRAATSVAHSLCRALSSRQEGGGRKGALADHVFIELTRHLTAFTECQVNAKTLVQHMAHAERLRGDAAKPANGTGTGAGAGSGKKQPMNMELLSLNLNSPQFAHAATIGASKPDKFSARNTPQHTGRNTGRASSLPDRVFAVGEVVELLCTLPNGSERWFPASIVVVHSAKVPAATLYDVMCKELLELGKSRVELREPKRRPSSTFNSAKNSARGVGGTARLTDASPGNVGSARSTPVTHRKALASSGTDGDAETGSLRRIAPGEQATARSNNGNSRTASFSSGAPAAADENQCSFADQDLDEGDLLAVSINSSTLPLIRDSIPVLFSGNKPLMANGGSAINLSVSLDTGLSLVQQCVQEGNEDDSDEEYVYAIPSVFGDSGNRDVIIANKVADTKKIPVMYFGNLNTSGSFTNMSGSSGSLSGGILRDTPTPVNALPSVSASTSALPPMSNRQSRGRQHSNASVSDVMSIDLDAGGEEELFGASPGRIQFLPGGLASAAQLQSAHDILNNEDSAAVQASRRAPDRCHERLTMHPIVLLALADLFPLVVCLLLRGCVWPPGGCLDVASLTELLAPTPTGSDAGNDDASSLFGSPASPFAHPLHLLFHIRCFFETACGRASVRAVSQLVAAGLAESALVGNACTAGNCARLLKLITPCTDEDPDDAGVGVGIGPQPVFLPCVVTHHLDETTAKCIGSGAFGSVYKVCCSGSCRANCNSKSGWLRHCQACAKARREATVAGAPSAGQEATDVCTDVSFAVKRIPREHTVHDCSVLLTVYSEVSCMKRMNAYYEARGNIHEGGTCVLFDYGLLESEYLMVMECGRMNLREWRNNTFLTRDLNSTVLATTNTEFALAADSLDVGQMWVLLLLLREISIIVADLHAAGIVHFDLKCDNFILREIPEMSRLVTAMQSNSLSGVLFVTDFGEATPCAVISDGDGDGAAGVVAVAPHLAKCKGTLAIQSPEMVCLSEQSTAASPVLVVAASSAVRPSNDTTVEPSLMQTLRGKPPSTPSDVWSLGLLAGELLTGEFLFYSSTWTELYCVLCMKMFTPTENVLNSSGLSGAMSTAAGGKEADLASLADNAPQYPQLTDVYQLLAGSRPDDDGATHDYVLGVNCVAELMGGTLRQVPAERLSSASIAEIMHSYCVRSHVASAIACQASELQVQGGMLTSFLPEELAQFSVLDVPGRPLESVLLSKGLMSLSECFCMDVAEPKPLSPGSAAERNSVIAFGGDAPAAFDASMHQVLLADYSAPLSMAVSGGADSIASGSVGAGLQHSLLGLVARVESIVSVQSGREGAAACGSETQLSVAGLREVVARDVFYGQQRRSVTLSLASADPITLSAGLVSHFAQFADANGVVLCQLRAPGRQSTSFLPISASQKDNTVTVSPIDCVSAESVAIPMPAVAYAALLSFLLQCHRAQPQSTPLGEGGAVAVERVKNLLSNALRPIMWAGGVGESALDAFAAAVYSQRISASVGGLSESLVVNPAAQTTTTRLGAAQTTTTRLPAAQTTTTRLGANLGPGSTHGACAQQFQQWIRYFAFKSLN